MRAAAQARAQISKEDSLLALADVIPASRFVATPRRVILDKLHSAVIDLSRTPVVLVPSVLGAPHLLVKHDPGLPAVVQYAIDSFEPVERAAGLPHDLVAARLRVLADPVRMRVCRMIARNPRSTNELAETLFMTAPEMSRQLRTLRELGLVSTVREGRFVLYSLRYEEVSSLGQDLLALLLR